MARRNANLGAAHRGYEYQDLVTSYFMADSLAHQSGRIVVDRKLFADDRFDDIAIRNRKGFSRRQFKRSDDPDRSLTLKDFTQDAYGLRIDHLVRTHLSMGSAPADEYRLCVTWKRPSDADIISCVELVQREPSFGSYPTALYRLLPDVIWPAGQDAIWQPLRGAMGINRDDFAGFAEHFRIEVECPPASGDFQNPGDLERLILEILADRVGIGRYPNQRIDPRSSAEALARRAQSARSRSEELGVGDIESFLGLRNDYGRVAQRFPVDKRTLVRRRTFQDALADTVLGSSLAALVGPPGSGKSWSLDQLAQNLRKAGHMVAQHYCYLEPGDPEVERRVTTNALFGNVIAGLVDAAPELREKSNRIYSAGLDELRSLLPHAVAASHTGEVFLIVDGIDHIARVVSSSRALASEETDIVEELAALPLPEGVHLIIGSQPGAHLAPLDENGLRQVQMPAWDQDDVVHLAARLGVVGAIRIQGVDEAEFLRELTARADGNPLYATYLCRELVSVLVSGSAEDPMDYLRRSPALTGNIANYYEHLLAAADPASLAVARLLAAIDFGVQEEDLRQILYPLSYLVPGALRRFAPVLKDVSAQGGVRVYHESFRRYVLEGLARDGIAISEVLDPLIGWLERKGFFSDSKSYRFLFSLFRRAGRDSDVLDRVDSGFVTASVEAGHPIRAILGNLDVATGAAGATRDWPALARCAQLRAAVDTCFREKLEPDAFGRTYVALSGAKSLAERLLFDGATTVGREQGLVFCSICDDAGAVPPWREYLAERSSALQRQAEEMDVGWEAGALAEFHGALRLRGVAAMVPKVARYLNERSKRPDAYVRGVLRRLGVEGGSSALKFLSRRLRRAATCRPLIEAELSEILKKEGNVTAGEEVAARALRHASDPESVMALLNAGAKPADGMMPLSDPAGMRIGVEPESNHLFDEAGASVRSWVAAVSVAARYGRADLLDSARNQVQGEGWYRQWLRYSIALAEAEAVLARGESASSLVVAAFQELASDTDPFRGAPRACDLYRLGPLIHETIGRGLALLNTVAEWKDATEALTLISEGTTTYLQGSQGGPLVPEELAVLLLPHMSSPDHQDRIVELLQEQVKRAEAHGQYYEVHAAHEMLLTRALISAGRHDAAAAHWSEAVRYLCSYGFHKDTLLFELTGSIPSLSRCDPIRARSCFSRLQPLTDIAVNHTDGKETRHLPNDWFRALAEAEPIGAADVLARSLSRNGGRYHWMAERALENLLALTRDASPLLRTYLFATMPFDGKSSGLDHRINAVDGLQAMGQSDNVQYWNLLAAQVQGDSEKFNPGAYAAVTAAAAERGVSIPTSETSIGKMEDDTPVARAGNPDIPILEDAFGNAVLFGQDATPLQIMSWIRAHERLRTGSSPLDWTRFAHGMAEALTRFVAEGREDDAVRLVRFVAREFFFGTDADLLAIIAEELERQGVLRLAATTWTLAFARSRGGDGWQVLGDAAHLQWVSRASQLYPGEFDRTLAFEVTDIVRGGRVYGITEHLVGLLAHSGDFESAFKVWEAAFGVLSARLPEPGGAHYCAFNEYDPAMIPQISLDEALFAVLAARIHQPELKRKTAALVGSMSALRAVPQVTVHGFRHLLRYDSPMTSVALALEILRRSEPEPYLVSRAVRDDLDGYLAVSHYGIRSGVARLLARISESRGNPVTELSSGQEGALLIGAPPRKIEAALSLDWGGRIAYLNSIWPAVGDEVGSRFHHEWVRLGESFKRRARSRHELARSHSQRRLPETRMLFWERELFEEILHSVAAELPARLVAKWQWRAGMEISMLERLLPRIDVIERHWHCRVCRPPLPLPSAQNARIGEPIPVEEAGPYNGWYRCGYYETEILMADSILPDSVGEATSMSGVFFGARTNPSPVGSLPFGIGTAADWMNGAEGRTILLAPFSGPLVGLDLMGDFLGQRPVLQLHPEIALRCGLRLTEQSRLMQLSDAAGTCAVQLRVWDVRSLGNDIGEETPILSGCDLLVRPDVFMKIKRMAKGEALEEVWVNE